MSATVCAPAPSRFRGPSRAPSWASSRARGPRPPTSWRASLRVRASVLRLARALACTPPAAALLACASAGAHPAPLAEPVGRRHTSRVLDAAAWGDRPVSHVEELLAGYVAGVAVTPAPGGYTVRVRGAVSLVGDAEPLYVVDGLPLVAQGPRTLAGLSPADVLRIEVLKDAADLTFYGVQGAHGVIRITTKRAPAR